MSADGKTVLLNATQDGGGFAGAVYLRHTDGSPPVKLADGFATALSPDGRWVVVNPIDPTGNLTLVPTGAGQSRSVDLHRLYDPGADWLPDGSHLLVNGRKPGE